MKTDLSDSLIAARALLGWRIIHKSKEGITAGYIVETEAYSSDDAASHSYRGESERTKIMFGPPGYMYVYFTYGMHYCVNVVTGSKGNGQGVLLRAVEPVEGVELMRKRRNKTDNHDLTNGPAKLAQAMGFNLKHNGESLLENSKLCLKPGFAPAQITQTTRIGISQAQDKPWRFYITGNPFVSRLC